MHTIHPLFLPFSPVFIASFFRHAVDWRHVYPFNNKFAWLVKGRYAHLIAGTEEKLGKFGIKRREQLQDRIKRMKQSMLAQVVLLGLLYLGVIATGLGILADATGITTGLLAVLDKVTAATAPLSGLLLVAVLIVRRHLAQLEADILLLLALRGT